MVAFTLEGETGEEQVWGEEIRVPLGHVKVPSKQLRGAQSCSEGLTIIR